MNPVLLPTSLVGSDPQPEWLIDRKNLQTVSHPAREHANCGAFPPEFLEEAQVRDLQFLRAIPTGDQNVPPTRRGLRENEGVGCRHHRHKFSQISNFKRHTSMQIAGKLLVTLNASARISI